MAPHSRSKRIEARKKYKVAKKVNQHHKKLRRAAKNDERKGRKEKDPGIPNSYPFKQELIEQIQKKREEDKQKRQEELERKREEAKTRKRSLKSLSEDAQRREYEFDEAAAAADGHHTVDRGVQNEGSRKAYMKEFRRVVDSADVILQVLDARDPLGCRCYEAERAIMAAGGGSKRIVLVLNKVDLVPKEVTQKWLTYLRNDFPTVAFRAALQGQAKVSAIHANEMKTSEALGADTLLQLLKNYTRNRNIKTACTIGIIGYPNVGKSSLINSLKRSRAVTVGATPGVTKSVQEVHLDKHLRLIDCPGIVFSSHQNDSLILRNCIKIENLDDPVSPVEVIIRRCGAPTLMVAYGIPEFNDITECLAMVAKKRGKVGKGGKLDLETAARTILQDWNGGKISFYTTPPAGPKSSRIAAEVVSTWGADFDIDAIIAAENKHLMETLPCSSAADQAKFATAEAVEEEGMVDDDSFLKSEEEEGDQETANDDQDADMDDEEDVKGSELRIDGEEEDEEESYGVVLETKKAKIDKDAPTKPKSKQEEKLNPQTNQNRKKDLKKLKKQRQRQPAAMAIDRADEDAYDFSVLDSDAMAQ